MTKKHVFRAGDYVKIVQPRAVARVGYPNDVPHYIERLKAAPAVLQAIGALEYAIIAELKGEADRVKVFDRLLINQVDAEILRAAARYAGRFDNYGGNERSLHYVDVPDAEGRIVHVVGVRVVKEGTYWAGDAEEGPLLYPQKPRRILSVDSSFRGHYDFAAEDVEPIPQMAVGARVRIPEMWGQDIAVFTGDVYRNLRSTETCYVWVGGLDPGVEYVGHPTRRTLQFAALPL